jgi:hypothetical protein
MYVLQNARSVLERKAYSAQYAVRLKLKARRSAQFIPAFIEGLRQLGWTVGRNVEIDIRWDAADAVRSRRYAAESAAPSVGVETSPLDVRDASEIERDIADFVRKLNGGLIVATSPAAVVNRKLIIDVAAKHRLAQCAVAA